MKKIFLICISIIGIMLMLFLNQNNTSNNQKLTIGIIQFMEHPALDVARQGFISKLDELGFKNHENIQILFESSQGNPALSSQIAQKFVGQDVDLIVAIGTTPAQAALQNIMQVKNKKMIPLVFLSITDPLDAKLVKRDVYGKLTSQYAAGISDYVEPQDHLKFFKEAMPSLLNLGIIYNPGEANSTTVLRGLERSSESFGINIISVSATKTSEVVLAAQSLNGKVDAIFIDNDNTALAAFESISNICKKNKIPLFVSDIDLVDKAVASLGPNQKRIGEQGAQLAALLLEKKSLPEDLGVQYADRVDLYLNKKFANEIDFKFSNELIKKAEKIIQ